MAAIERSNRLLNPHICSRSADSKSACSTSRRRPSPSTSRESGASASKGANLASPPHPERRALPSGLPRVHALDVEAYGLRGGLKITLLARVEFSQRAPLLI